MSKRNGLGKRVKAYRLDNQMTQERMASFLGVGLRTLIRIEQGIKPGDLTRAKIEKLLAREMVEA